MADARSGAEKMMVLERGGRRQSRRGVLVSGWDLELAEDGSVRKVEVWVNGMEEVERKVEDEMVEVEWKVGVYVTGVEGGWRRRDERGGMAEAGRKGEVWMMVMVEVEWRVGVYVTGVEGGMAEAGRKGEVWMAEAGRKGEVWMMVMVERKSEISWRWCILRGQVT
ncbi:hypothetical protein BC829DRAFT_429494 [Chytridium lagenaria]|nr:hypothetical protein BC829DRAFT_429494 [Chytridium lagenaria]